MSTEDVFEDFPVSFLLIFLCVFIVSLALWKKALIGVFCILLLVAIVIVLTVFLRKYPIHAEKSKQLSYQCKMPLRFCLTSTSFVMS